MEKQSAVFYLPLNKKPLFDIVEDPIPDLGKTLIANCDFPKGSAVVIYFGKIITTEENFLKYMSNPKEYIEKFASYIRATPDQSKNIDASELIENPSSNPNLMGVLVNDIAKPKSTDLSDLKEYLTTEDQCNLIVSDFTRDYPVYFANRDIKKGEYLTIHYGLGYWLLQMGIEPQDISKLLKMCEQ